MSGRPPSGSRLAPRSALTPRICGWPTPRVAAAASRLDRRPGMSGTVAVADVDQGLDGRPAAALPPDGRAIVSHAECTFAPEQWPSHDAVRHIVCTVR